MIFETIYYEPAALQYPLGQRLRGQYPDAKWIEIESHNDIEVLRKSPNSQFPALKRVLVVGTRKTHAYRENHKVSDFLVPYTSSGCTAMCLYCYLVCHYNKCAYLRLFVNREQMLDRLMKKAAATGSTFEIGSNSDLVLENQITGNLDWTIPQFAKPERGFITFPTKFCMVESLLGLDHRGRVIARVSVNPQAIIGAIEKGTASLERRIWAANQLGDAGYKVGLIIAPIVLVPGWEPMYLEMLDVLAQGLSEKVKRQMAVEVIFMTYSFVHRAINQEAFPDAPQLYDRALMTGRGRGMYTYNQQARQRAEALLRSAIEEKLGRGKILYIV